MDNHNLNIILASDAIMIALPGLKLLTNFSEAHKDQLQTVKNEFEKCKLLFRSLGRRAWRKIGRRMLHDMLRLERCALSQLTLLSPASGASPW